MYSVLTYVEHLSQNPQYILIQVIDFIFSNKII